MMNRIRILSASLLLTCLGGIAAAGDPGPTAGDPAPGFRLQDQNFEWHTLADYRDQWLVLFFYPKADTPGCTKEACAFRDDIFKFRKMGVRVLGISLDDVASQKEFADKYSLPYPLLSDAHQDTARAYGVLRNLGIVKMARRETFIIAPDGTLARHYEKVDPETHSAQVLADLEQLIHTDSA